MLESVRLRQQKLAEGGWSGKGSLAFQREMESEVLPAMHRLITALDAGAQTIDEIVAVMREAEEAAARLFSERGTLANQDYPEQAFSKFDLSPPRQGGVPEPPGGPPVPVPGAPPGTTWRRIPPSAPGRRPKWVPTPPLRGQSQPEASWDPAGAHWDVNDGLGSPRQRYDEDGNPLTPDEAHDINHPNRNPPPQPAAPDEDIIKKLERITGLTGVALLIYIIISEGLRIVFPPRNLAPIP